MAADDVRRAKVLELGRIGTGLAGKLDEAHRTIQLSVVVGSDVSNEIGRMTVSYPPGPDCHLRHVL
jgi:hypothetical protein